jgi:hypothetical protein
VEVHWTQAQGVVVLPDGVVVVVQTVVGVTGTVVGATYTVVVGAAVVGVVTGTVVGVVAGGAPPVVVLTGTVVGVVAPVEVLAGIVVAGARCVEDPPVAPDAGRPADVVFVPGVVVRVEAGVVVGFEDEITGTVVVALAALAT